MSKIGGHRRCYVGFRGLWEGSQAELISRDNALVCAEPQRGSWVAFPVANCLA